MRFSHKDTDTGIPPRGRKRSESTGWQPTAPCPESHQKSAAFKEARETKGMPTAIIAKTVKGKGVSFMEDKAAWHGTAPNDEQFAVAMEDLEKVGAALCQK